MGKERMPHDPAYKQFFSNPEMVESLLRDFVSADFIADLDFSTLERCSGSYVTDDLRERHDDIVWRVGWKKGSWCYVALLLEFQSTPDHWMALRTLSYTTLLLLDLVKTGKVRENEGLPPVFPIVIYNGGKAWKAPQEVAALFAPMPEGLKYYRPQHRHFLLDESRVSGEELDKSKGLVAQLLRLERAQEPEQVRQIVRELIARLHGPEYLSLRRAFTVWLGRVVLKRSGITEEIPEFQDLREVDAMLEERAAQWKNEYITLGRKEGEAKGLGRGVQLLLEARFGALPASVTTYISSSSDSNTLQKMMLSAYHAESLQSFIELIKKN
ncbi:Rpn family recombination-promoting nuclease/putative transposase [Bilophila wadsworthia]|jgi:predicted transposase/invertase (TIGR01784 family)|uniref:Rpn family recombination-promoting nuclease/putative transposase n=1 Tax=Bilophila wadsworthia TaxID=35833 RepID=UPI00266550AE|nr:Rpn family recombination-promoting nuclease/putative transposase [Bilophila wadsworthia]